MMKTRAGAGTGRAGRSGYVIGDVTGLFYRLLGVLGVLGVLGGQCAY